MEKTHILNHNLTEGLVCIPSTGKWEYGKITYFYPRPDCPFLAIIFECGRRARRIPSDTMKIVSQEDFEREVKSKIG